MQPRLAVLVLAAGISVLPAALAAQGAQVPFGAFQHDRAAPIEVTADELSVSQADGAATFEGNVVIGQGDMRLSAQTVRVEYDAGGDGIARLHAEGSVTLVTGAQAAEAQSATYDVVGGEVVMEGDVIVTEAGNALSGQRLVVDLEAGTGRMEGRVRTILQGGGGQ